ncbi:MAG: class I tRNA ligase family protein [Candidatus Hodgkinia cicadicola]
MITSGGRVNVTSVYRFYIRLIYELNENANASAKALSVCLNRLEFAVVLSTQPLTISEVTKLEKARHVAFKKKTSTVWGSIGSKTSVLTVPTASTVSTATTSVSFVISKRRQLRRCKTATVLHVLTSMIGMRYKFLGQVLKTDCSKVWMIPWVTNLSVPNNGLKSISLRGRLSICVPRIELVDSATTLLLPTQLAKQLTVLNVFNKTHMPITSARFKTAASIDLVCNDGTLSKLSTTAWSTKRYSKQFKRRVVNLATRTVVGEIHVTNRLLTRNLIEKSDPTSWVLLASCEANKSATCCVSSQWYIRVNSDIKVRAYGMFDYVKFLLNIVGYQLLRFMRIKPDWVSRRRYWGVPSCFHRNRKGEIIWDEEFVHGIYTLLSKYGNRMWHKLLNSLARYDKWDRKKVTNVFDALFDASSMLASRGNQLPWHMAVKGEDQYGSWFQSGLLNCVLTQNRLAFEVLIVHLFLILNKS